MQKRNKGITIIMLVITIIVMLIITSFAVFYSVNVAPEAKIAAAFTSLREIKEASLRALNEIEVDPANLDEYYFFGKTIQLERPDQVDELKNRCGINTAIGEDFSDRTYMIYSPQVDDPNEEAVRRRLELLELTNLNSYEFIVDLGNKKFYLVDGVERLDEGNSFNNKRAYEYTDIELLYSMITATNK